MIFGLILYNKNQKTPSHIRDEVIRGSTLSRAILLSLKTLNVCHPYPTTFFPSPDQLPNALQKSSFQDCLQPMTVSLFYSRMYTTLSVHCIYQFISESFLNSFYAISLCTNCHFVNRKVIFRIPGSLHNFVHCLPLLCCFHRYLR